MWPLDRTQEYLRVGRHSVERWVGASDALLLAGSADLGAAPELDAERLTPILQSVFAAKPARGITVLLESVWLPLLLVEVGPAIWTPEQAHTLLQYRLGPLHGRENAVTTDWDLRIDYRAGERFALGYGVPRRLTQVFVDTGAALGLQWSALLPSFAWGLQRLRPARPWSGGTGWWAWPEQDRLVLARIAGKQVVVLNAGVASSEDPEQIARLVEVECVRSGTSTVADPIGVATWSSIGRAATMRDRVRWVSIAGHANPPATQRSARFPSKVYP